METMYDRIKRLRESLGMSQEDLAEHLGYTSRSSISKIEAGCVDLPQSKIKKFAEVLRTTPNYLMGEDDNKRPHPNLMPIKTKKWRVLGDIACGEPIYADEDFDSYIEAGADIPADFCVRAKGDSMINARIQDGDIVFIRKQPIVENGDIAAVIIGDDITLKRFYKHGDTVYLQSENPAYEPFMYNKEELDQIYIIGKAVAFQSDIK